MPHENAPAEMKRMFRNKIGLSAKGTEKQKHKPIVIPRYSASIRPCTRQNAFPSNTLRSTRQDVPGKTNQCRAIVIANSHGGEAKLQPNNTLATRMPLISHSPVMMKNTYRDSKISDRMISVMCPPE